MNAALTGKMTSGLVTKPSRLSENREIPALLNAEMPWNTAW
jgi:hypothetical protein